MSQCTQICVFFSFSLFSSLPRLLLRLNWACVRSINNANCPKKKTTVEGKKYFGTAFRYVALFIRTVSDFFSLNWLPLFFAAARLI